MSGDRLDYYSGRAAQELAAAEAAKSEVAADIHRVLAARFAELAHKEASIHPSHRQEVLNQVQSA
jgi:hypothetical protein